LLDLTAKKLMGIIEQREIRLISAVARGGKCLQASDVQSPVVLALGSEGAGLPREIEEAGMRVSIPLAPTVESLNVAAAAAVLLYEIMRQRQAVSGVAVTRPAPLTPERRRL
jgi:TrmH family RNA methyltransferase